MTERPSEAGGFGRLGHLAGRFFTSLRPGGPPPTDERWARQCLSSAETGLWSRMSAPDRRHAVGVARDVASSLRLDPGAAGGRPVLAAALLHDTGKIASGLGTWARAGVTAAALVAGRERMAGWSERGARRGPFGWRGRAGRYLTHDRLGAEMLAAAGSDPLTVAWAAEHHLPPERWTVDRRVGEALKAADGD